MLPGRERGIDIASCRSVSGYRHVPEMAIRTFNLEAFSYLAHGIFSDETDLRDANNMCQASLRSVSFSRPFFSLTLSKLVMSL